MRDPTRIARITAKLARAWEASPDLRLGQLAHNIVIRHSQRDHELTFNLEDDVFEAALDKWLAEPSTYVMPPVSVSYPCIPYTGWAGGTKIERADGTISEVPHGQLFLTGMPPTIADLRAGKTNRSELGTIGYFYGPNGQLCDSSCYDKYIKS